MTPLLSVVVPVYNEAAAIEPVLAEWIEVLDRLQAPYEIRAYDDGSRDGSEAILRRMAQSFPGLVVTSQANRGHGPTILRGYAEARGDWILQIDGDGELPAANFERLWAVRDDYDFLIGSRHRRLSSWHRRILTRGSRAITALLFGRVVSDVNSPYRLMRASWLRPLMQVIPAGAAVPNIILSGLAARTHARVLEIPIDFRGRRAGTSSLNLRRLATLAWAAVRDAFAVARRTRRMR